MATINSFDNKSVNRIARVTRSYEKDVIRTKQQPKRRRSTASGGSNVSGGVLVEVDDNGAALPSYNCSVYGNGYGEAPTAFGVAVPVVTHPLTKFAKDTRMVAILGSALTTGEI